MPSLGKSSFSRSAFSPFEVLAKTLALGVFLLVACGGGGGGSAVAAVQLQTTNANPRVGETAHVGATPVNAGGVAVQGVGCVFVSSAPGIATVDASNGTVTAISPGVATITASCGGKSASVAITVRPNEFALTVQKQGNGGGGVFASPPGSPNYVPGTSVTVTATANPGSAFTAWGGACDGVPTSSPCELIMDSDLTVIATFELAETFLSGTWNASLGTVTDSIGCQYAISASGVLTLKVVERLGGTAVGSASTTAHIDIVNTASPPFTTCTPLPFDTSGTGDISGSDASLAASLASSSGRFTFAFSGARSDTTITGSAVVHETLQDGYGVDYPTSGNTGTFALTKQ
jgi:hypothetical protein